MAAQSAFVAWPDQIRSNAANAAGNQGSSRASLGGNSATIVVGDLQTDHPRAGVDEREPVDAARVPEGIKQGERPPASGRSHRSGRSPTSRRSHSMSSTCRSTG